MIEIRGRHWACVYCGRKYVKAKEAEACYDSHDVVMIPIAHSDMVLLQNFFLNADTKYIPQNFYNMLVRALRAKFDRSIRDEKI